MVGLVLALVLCSSHFKDGTCRFTNAQKKKTNYM